MFDFIRERLRELREGLEALKAEQQRRQEEEVFGEFEEWEPATPRGGHRRTAPIYVRGSPDEPTPGRLPPGTANLDLNLDTSPPPASHTGRDALHELRAKLREPGRLREAVVMREILDRPLGLRRPARRSFRDR